MVEQKDPAKIDAPAVRCSRCDREMDHYNVFMSATGEERPVCWQCLARDEKGFNAKRDFSRQSRRGVIPR
jgi:hypothetical protein